MKSTEGLPDAELHPPWQGTMLACLCVFQTFFTLMFFLFLSKLAYEGFKAGEMGTMIGIFGIIILVFLFPLLILMIIITIGVFKKRRWTFILLLVVTCISLLGGILSLVTGPVVFLLVTPFLGLMLWAEIVCLKSPYYHKKIK